MKGTLVFYLFVHPSLAHCVVSSQSQYRLLFETVQFEWKGAHDIGISNRRRRLTNSNTQMIMLSNQQSVGVRMGLEELDTEYVDAVVV